MRILLQILLGILIRRVELWISTLFKTEFLIRTFVYFYEIFLLIGIFKHRSLCHYRDIEELFVAVIITECYGHLETIFLREYSCLIIFQSAQGLNDKRAIPGIHHEYILRRHDQSNYDHYQRCHRTSPWLMLRTFLGEVKSHALSKHVDLFCFFKVEAPRSSLFLLLHFFFH